MSEDRDWTENYFNYFTEIEEHFQRARGTGLFLLSPLDWTLIESWKDAGVPLEAVLRGIDEAFEGWRARRSGTRMVNSLAYCAQTVLTNAQQMTDNATAPARRDTTPPFSVDELRAYLAKNAENLRARPGQVFAEIAASLERLAADAATHYSDPEDLERRLTALEEKMTASARAAAPEEALLEARREFELQLRPYRSKMTADQIAMLERQFIDRALLEKLNLPRLSLFYFR